MDITAVRQGLADAADAIAGLNCYAYIPTDLVDPAFVVGEVDINYDQAYGRGLDELIVTCYVYVSTGDSYAGQRTLDAYLAGSGTSSVKTAIQAARGAPGSPALSGAADDLHVQRVQGYRMYQIGDRHYYGAEFAVRVIGSGS